MLLAKEFAVALEVAAEHAEAFGEIGFGQQFPVRSRWAVRRKIHGS